MPDSMRDNEGRIDAPAEDVQPAGGAGYVLQGEIGSDGGFMAYYDECTHGIRIGEGIQASFVPKRIITT
jgi:hypothetical protein